MNTYELHFSSVTIVIEADDEYDATHQAENMLADIALDWAPPSVEEY